MECQWCGGVGKGRGPFAVAAFKISRLPRGWDLPGACCVIFDLKYYVDRVIVQCVCVCVCVCVSA